MAGMPTCICNPGTIEMEEGEFKVSLSYTAKFKTSLGYGETLS